MNSNRNSIGQFKGQQNDGERMTAAEKAARRAELARLSAQVDAEALGGKIAAQMQAAKPVAVKRVDVNAKSEMRLARMRQMAAEAQKGQGR